MHAKHSTSCSRSRICSWLFSAVPFKTILIRREVRNMHRILGTVGLLVITLISSAISLAQQPTATPQTSQVTVQASPAPTLDPNDPIARIREEGLKHSQVMETLSYLSDVIGPRLTGSPNLKRANEWTRDRMTRWGLQNAHLESWGPFGRGW